VTRPPLRSTDPDAELPDCALIILVLEIGTVWLVVKIPLFTGAGTLCLKVVIQPASW
jgi:hypothetical protein